MQHAFVLLNFIEGVEMDLKGYIELGLLNVLIFVFSISTFIMAENLFTKIFAGLIIIAVSFSVCYFFQSLDHYLQIRKFDLRSADIYQKLKQAWEYSSEEMPSNSDLETLALQVDHIMKKYLVEGENLTFVVYKLDQIEGDLIRLIEIQSIFIKLKKHLDDTVVISRERKDNERVQSALQYIRENYKRACILYNLNYRNYVYKLNLYKTILCGVETESDFMQTVYNQQVA